MTIRVLPGGKGKPKPPPARGGGGTRAPTPPQTGGGGGGGGRGGGHAWEDLFTQVNGGPAPTTHNAVLILQHDPAWKDSLQFDEFAQRVVFVKEPPCHEYKPNSLTPPKERDGDESVSSQLQRFIGREVADEDCARAATWIERAWHIKMTSATLHEAMEIVARTCSVHPVRQFLSALVWDGISRLGRPVRAPGTRSPSDEGDLGSIAWLARYMGAADDDYTRRVGRWWLISAIARIFLPGCQAQHMMILEGKQGLGKSRALRALFEPWFSEDLPDTTSKDALQQLAGVWGMEIAEMDAIAKGGPNAAKRFISKAIDRYRPPYARRVRDFPRQVVFCGTTNATAYLQDTTGNRRYWPVLTNDIDVDLLRAERDQLLAEAVLAFQAGEDWWPEPSDIEMLKAQQDARVEQDAWHGSVLRWLRDRKNIDQGVTVGTVLEAMNIDKSRWGPAEERRVVRLLLQIGRVRVHREYDGFMQWVYDLSDAPNPYEHAPAEAPQAAPEPAPVPEPIDPQAGLWDDDPDDDWKLRRARYCGITPDNGRRDQDVRGSSLEPSLLGRLALLRDVRHRRADDAQASAVAWNAAAHMRRGPAVRRRRACCP